MVIGEVPLAPGVKDTLAEVRVVIALVNVGADGGTGGTSRARTSCVPAESAVKEVDPLMETATGTDRLVNVPSPN